MTNQVTTNFSGNLSDYEFSSSGSELFVTDKTTGMVTSVSTGILSFHDGSSINAYIAETNVNYNDSLFSQNASRIKLSGGGFVVSGMSSDHNFFASIYASDSNLIRTVSLSQPYSYTQSSVAGTSDGGFVVARTGGSNSDVDIYIQKFDAVGALVGGEVLVNTVTSGMQTNPHIAILVDGSYIVTWSNGNDGLFMQHLDSNGIKVGGEIQVSSSNTSSSAVTQLSNNQFVVTWEDGSGINSQIYGSDGLPVGSAFNVSGFCCDPKYCGIAGWRLYT